MSKWNKTGSFSGLVLISAIEKQNDGQTPQSQKILNGRFPGLDVICKAWNRYLLSSVI